jgi:hypothetical protein
MPASKRLGFWVGFWIFLLGFNPSRGVSDTAPITVPAEAGRVESYHASKKPNAPLIVLIQDAHGHYEAQRSLAEILKSLVLQHGLDLVMVEGGSGDLDLTYLREGVPLERVEEVAERYLQTGKISGEEFLDMTLTEKEFKLWGLEDSKLYAQNVEAYLSFFKEQKQAVEHAAGLKEKVLPLRETYYPKEFYELESLKEASERREVSALSYFGLLTEKAKAAGIATDSFPVFREWLALREKEEGLDPSRLELEKKELTGALSRALTKEELYPLRKGWTNSGLASEASHWRTLVDLKREYQPKFDPYSTVQIEKALRLTKEAEAIHASRLFDEADQIYRAIRTRLLPEGEARRLAGLLDYLVLTEKLFRLQWTPRDLAHFEELKKSWDPKSASEFLRPEDAFEKISRTVPLAKRFYEIAREREGALLANALKKIKEQARDLYAVVAGGFHADDLTERFREEGFSVLSVSPRFEPSEETSSYFEILREKWEKR